MSWDKKSRSSSSCEGERTCRLEYDDQMLNWCESCPLAAAQARAGEVLLSTSCRSTRQADEGGSLTTVKKLGLLSIVCSLWGSKDPSRFFDSIEVLTGMIYNFEGTQSIKKCVLWYSTGSSLSFLLSQPCWEHQLLLYWYMSSMLSRPVDSTSFLLNVTGLAHI